MAETHSHAHPEAHGHGHGHAHGIAPDADARRLWIAFGLIVAFMAGEVVAGFLSGSLALLADAAHMLTDAGAIGLALVAMRLARRPPAGGLTFGLQRAEILSAQANGVTLLVLGALVVYEGVRRLIVPPRVEPKVMLVVALVGIAVNLLASWQLARAERRSLNVEGSLQHVLTDLYAFIGTAIAAAVIWATGFRRADPIASLVVAVLMLRAAWQLLRASGRVLLEAAPEGLNPEEVGQACAEVEGVIELHDLHIWEISTGFASLAAHVLMDGAHEPLLVRHALETLLAERFHIEHTTLQVDRPDGERLHRIRPKPQHPQGGRGAPSASGGGATEG